MNYTEVLLRTTVARNFQGALLLEKGTIRWTDRKHFFVQQ